MKLYATPMSHFSRKVRILLDLYKVPYELVDVGNVAEGDLATFASNPLMKVPVLVDGDTWLIESDHIAHHLARVLDPQDRYRVRASALEDLNFRAVLNGIMADEVRVILARRTGVPTAQFQFFADALESIENGLRWLEAAAARFDTASPGYREFHLVCMFQHVDWYELVPLEYPRLRAIVDEVLRKVPELARTAPLNVKPRPPKPPASPRNGLRSAVKSVEEPPRAVVSAYPDPFKSRMKNRVKRQLGDAFGIKKFGVNLTELKPGGESSLLHKHTKQEEFIYVVSGKPTLVLESEELTLEPGMCAGFTPSGSAHQLVNRTNESVWFLEIGDREAGDEGTYPKDDIVAKQVDGKWVFTRKDGTPY